MTVAKPTIRGTARLLPADDGIALSQAHMETLVVGRFTTRPHFSLIMSLIAGMMIYKT